MNLRHARWLLLASLSGCSSLSVKSEIYNGNLDDIVESMGSSLQALHALDTEVAAQAPALKSAVETMVARQPDAFASTGASLSSALAGGLTSVLSDTRPERLELQREAAALLDSASGVMEGQRDCSNVDFMMLHRRAERVQTLSRLHVKRVKELLAERLMANVESLVTALKLVAEVRASAVSTPPAEEPAKPESPKPAEEPAKPESAKPAEEPAKPESPKPGEEPALPESPKPAEEPAKPESSKPAEEPSKPESAKPTERATKPQIGQAQDPVRQEAEIRRSFSALFAAEVAPAVERAMKQVEAAGVDSAAADPDIARIANAPSGYWSAVFNKVVGETWFGNAEIAIRSKNGLREFQMKGVLFDPSQVTRATIDGVAGAIQVAAAVSGLPSFPTQSDGSGGQVVGDGDAANAVSRATIQAQAAALIERRANRERAKARLFADLLQHAATASGVEAEEGARRAKLVGLLRNAADRLRAGTK